MSDPARRARDDRDAREGGSLTPHSNLILCFCGRPGRQKTPADLGSDIGASPPLLWHFAVALALQPCVVAVVVVVMMMM